MAEDVSRLGKIFVAGTGRSGTTVLSQLIGHHPDGYWIPEESEFIAHGHGLQAVIPLLCDNYSYFASPMAFADFLAFIGSEWNGTEWQIDWRPLGEKLGAELTYRAVSDYLDDLRDYDFKGLVIPRHFTERRELIALTRRFVAELFGRPALAQQKSFWVEKTPANIMILDLLWELFPEATIIHIKRDPRGVVHSIVTKEEWQPISVRDAAESLATIYWRWQRAKPKLWLEDRRYVEIKLEDLVADPAACMREIERVTGIGPGRCDLAGLDAGMVDRWKTEMTRDDRRYCERRLADYFDLMGYDL